MTDVDAAVTQRIEDLQLQLEHADIAADLTLGFYAEARDVETLCSRMEATIRDTARDEARLIVTIDLGGVLRTDDGYRCWGSFSLAGIGVSA